MSERNDAVRPQVMDAITESELQELRLRFDDDDQAEFIALAGTYGWSLDDADQVWNFFVAGKLQQRPGETL
jgi:hypothetical protein